MTGNSERPRTCGTTGKGGTQIVTDHGTVPVHPNHLTATADLRDGTRVSFYLKKDGRKQCAAGIRELHTTPSATSAAELHASAESSVPNAHYQGPSIS